ncbi:hypothetical protein Fot_21149 [Forsythia ovata]|uniref:Uncharacterized protein n=1 Tax=Forsythia ovata TaxID=205694 RepID=A0ABD1UV63_9LAMI
MGLWPVFFDDLNGSTLWALGVWHRSLPGFCFANIASILLGSAHAREPPHACFGITSCLIRNTLSMASAWTLLHQLSLLVKWQISTTKSHKACPFTDVLGLKLILIRN